MFSPWKHYLSQSEPANSNFIQKKKTPDFKAMKLKSQPKSKPVSQQEAPLSRGSSPYRLDRRRRSQSTRPSSTGSAARRHSEVEAAPGAVAWRTIRFSICECSSRISRPSHRSLRRRRRRRCLGFGTPGTGEPIP